MLKKAIRQRLANLLGWSTHRKILVFESDDWGSTRFRDKKTRNFFIKKYPKIANSWMDCVDTIESNEDLERLFELLFQYKDKYNNNPKITPFCNLANPDYERIEESGFNSYYLEVFTETLKRFDRCDRVEILYKDGIRNNIFIPQYHGREHIHINRWMNALKSQVTPVVEGFRHQYWSFNRSLHDLVNHDFRVAYDIDRALDLKSQLNIDKSGLGIFESIFGYKARVMVPPNGFLSTKLEDNLFDLGIRYIGISKLQNEPTHNGKKIKRINYLGKKSKSGIRYITRNAIFEPCKDNSDWVDLCLRDIEIAYRYKKPAIVSSHRANYVCGLDNKNSSKGLSSLRLLLDTIKKKWPDVEFMSTSQLGDLIVNGRHA